MKKLNLLAITALLTSSLTAPNLGFFSCQRALKAYIFRSRFQPINYAKNHPDLSDRGLTSLPKKLLKHVSQIEGLNLSNNKLIELPGSVGVFENLKTLNLSHNYLKILPLSLGECEQLEELDISFNAFGSIPVVLIRLIATEKLKKLTIDGILFNDIKHQIPHVISLLNKAELVVIDEDGEVLKVYNLSNLEESEEKTVVPDVTNTSSHLYPLPASSPSTTKRYSKSHPHFQNEVELFPQLTPMNSSTGAAIYLSAITPSPSPNISCPGSAQSKDSDVLTSNDAVVGQDLIHREVVEGILHELIAIVATENKPESVKVSPAVFSRHLKSSVEIDDIEAGSISSVDLSDHEEDSDSSYEKINQEGESRVTGSISRNSHQDYFSGNSSVSNK